METHLKIHPSAFKCVFQSVPWLRHLGAGFWPRMPGFGPRQVHVRFVVSKVSLEQDFSPSISGFPSISLMVHHRILFTHNTCYIILATDIIIKQNVSLFCFPNTWETQSDTGTWTVEIWQHGLCLVMTYSACLGTAYFVCFFNIVNTGTLSEISNASIFVGKCKLEHLDTSKGSVNSWFIKHKI